MRQEQRLTPQLIQSMNILQLNITALEQRIQEELERNPILEFQPDDGVEAAMPAEESAPAEPPSVQEQNNIEVLEWLSEQYDLDGVDRPTVSLRESGERDSKLDAMANTASRPTNLYEHLQAQWNLVELDPDMKRAGEAILNFIEEDGLLRTPMADIAQTIRPPLEIAVVEATLVKIQQLEPVGVGARSLQETLLLQLKMLPGDNSLEENLIRDHFEDLLKNRLPQIAKALDTSIDELKESLKVLARLTPTPGLSVGDRDVPTIKPDVIVEYDENGQGYTVRLARGNEPRLHISKRYLDMLKDRSQDKDARDYLKKQYESATALIDAIAFRKNRLLEVAQAVVERQQDFFDQGPQAMKVLRMSELAEQFSCDPSTISRTVADKYLQAPRGIYPLREFFVGGTENRVGETTSWDSVKARVQELINQEDKTNPLSDDQVAAMMCTEGVDISRRTVAKYRQQLNIATARQRKVF
ncbi:MAG: RNA polymerase sigma-54 factor [Phycisphaerae bacterium]|nr:RNA polymerase sigma-54 factor [Phycisphaerae bacterium]